MPARETGKQRATRIPLDYYKRPDRLLRWRRRLALAAFIVALAWLATGFAPGGRWGVRSNGLGRLRYSHGPVAKVHATWEAQCEVCHVPFQPTGAGTGWTKILG